MIAGAWERAVAELQATIRQQNAQTAATHQKAIAAAEQLEIAVNTTLIDSLILVAQANGQLQGITGLTSDQQNAIAAIMNQLQADLESLNTGVLGLLDTYIKSLDTLLGGAKRTASQWPAEQHPQFINRSSTTTDKPSAGGVDSNGTATVNGTWHVGH
mgnify:CR=1 FL=1